MHDIKWIRETPEGLDRALARRNMPAEERSALLARIRTLDETRRETLTKLEGLLARRNAASKEVGQAKAAKDEARAAALMEEVGRLKVEVPALEQTAKATEAELDKVLAAIPNAPLDVVPDGKDEHDNVEVKLHGTKRAYAFEPKQHFEVGEGLGLMDFDTAAKLSGARFVVNKGPLARLERALGQFFLDVHTASAEGGIGGYTEVNPPLLVRDEAMFGTAQLPKFEDDQFFTDPRTPEWEEETRRMVRQASLMTLGAGEGPFSREQVDAIIRNVANNAADTFMLTNAGAIFDSEPRPFTPKRLGLIPTAEVPLTNLVRDSILAEDELPLRFTACTPCFRAEAGSAGRDTRGMIRQHQFTKVELVSITTPEQALAEHERMLACAEAVLQKLDLHYRVVTLCTGDMGFASQKTYDIEVWLPGQNAYREISSCSVCGDFQARRMNARYRPTEGKDGGKAAPRFVHTLNGSGVAVGRALVAVLETYQQVDGSVIVPEVLRPYMGGVTVIEKAK